LPNPDAPLQWDRSSNRFPFCAAGARTFAHLRPHRFEAEILGVVHLCRRYRPVGSRELCRPGILRVATIALTCIAAVIRQH
jgi:hypothetical protein